MAQSDGLPVHDATSPNFIPEFRTTDIIIIIIIIIIYHIQPDFEPAQPPLQWIRNIFSLEVKATEAEI
jgi:hypothetical protein